MCRWMRAAESHVSIDAIIEPRGRSGVFFERDGDPRDLHVLTHSSPTRRSSELAGVPIDTVRDYERQRLIPEPARSASGYRQYAQDDVTRLNFIRRAKTLGFTLEDIGELMEIRDRKSVV